MGGWAGGWWVGGLGYVCVFVGWWVGGWVGLVGLLVCSFRIPLCPSSKEKPNHHVGPPLAHTRFLVAK